MNIGSTRNNHPLWGVKRSSAKWGQCRGLFVKSLPDARSRTSSCGDERAVSEVLGVIMMMAMVVTIMGGVWVFLNPYLVDFQDNTNWKSAVNIADRIDDRIDVAGSSPENTGIRNTYALKSTILMPVENVEKWSISADLVSYDRIEIINLNHTTLSILAANETARSVKIENNDSSFTQSFQASHEAVIIQHNISKHHWIMITVYDEDNTPIHRQFEIVLSGLTITTSFGEGEHQIALMNNARTAKFPNEPWQLTRLPNMEIDSLASGEFRFSILLTDITLGSSLGSSNTIAVNFESLGALTLFSGEAHNVRFVVNNYLHDVITPQYHDSWLTDYKINRASGTLDSYTGYSPYQRASGADGFTIETQDAILNLEVDLQRIEVSR